MEQEKMPRKSVDVVGEIDRIERELGLEGSIGDVEKELERSRKEQQRRSVSDQVRDADTSMRESEILEYLRGAEEADLPIEDMEQQERQGSSGESIMGWLRSLFK